MFDHKPSLLVDVFQNTDGEFVQIWDSTSKTPGRRLLMTYLRTPTGPREICHRIYLTEGPFELVEVTDSQRTFYSRNGKSRRVERFLPSGMILVDEPQRGMTIRRVYTEAFDWENSRPIGEPLGDRSVMKLQASGKLWYISIYQDSPEAASALRLVEEYQGRKLKSTLEVGSA